LACKRDNARCDRRVAIALMARKLTIEDVAEIALSFPGVEEGKSWGTRAWRVGKSFMFRAKERMDDVLVVGVDNLDEKELLLEQAPELYFTTDHYNGYPALLVRVSAMGKRQLKAFIERAWRRAAPAKMIAAFDAK
jgi:hypothetical protein